MSPFDWLFGVASLASFALNVAQVMLRARAKATEEIRVASSTERLKRAKLAMIAAGETVHMVVARAKEEAPSKQAKPAELANLARTARGQLQLAVRELENEEEQLADWQFGQFSSDQGS